MLLYILPITTNNKRKGCKRIIFHIYTCKPSDQNKYPEEGKWKHTNTRKGKFAENPVCKMVKVKEENPSRTISVVFYPSKGKHVVNGRKSKIKRDKMSKLVCFVTIVCILVGLLKPSGAGAIHSDDKNIAKLLNNQVIVSRQIMCVLDKSPCDQLGRQLKGRCFVWCLVQREKCFFFLLYFSELWIHRFPLAKQKNAFVVLHFR